MALLGTSFNSDEAEDLSFEPLPVGEYIAKIIESEIKTTSAGNGEYFKNVWEIVDAEDSKHIGRKVYQNINYVNPSEMATKIGKSQLKQLCEALGIKNLVDTNELIGQPLKVTLKIRPAKDGYDAQNEIKKVQPLEDSDSGSTGDTGEIFTSAPWEDED